MTMDAFAQLIADYAGSARVKAREGAVDEARQRLVQAPRSRSRRSTA
ncbi:hypothetical protein [Falsiroseomonas bella]|nr:hypothetical protein [Falsiroseomonas bella]